MRLWLFVLMLMAMVTSLWAEDSEITPEEYGKWIGRRVIEIQKDFGKGNKQQALEAVLALKTEVSQYTEFMDGRVSYWWPDIGIVRIAWRMKQDDLIVTHAAPAIVAMDAEPHRLEKTRLELMLYLTQALYRMRKYNEVEPVSRQLKSLLSDPDAKPKSSWLTNTDYMLAISATRNNAPDAAQLRRSVLEGFMDKPGAKQAMFLNLWELDLKSRYDAKAKDLDVLNDARFVHDYLAAEYTGDDDRNQDLLGLLGRIFTSNKDYLRASNIMETRLKYLTVSKPLSHDYFFAIQNLAALDVYRNNLQQALSRTEGALSTLVGLPEERFGLVTSSLERTLAAIYKRLDQPQLEQLAWQRAYVAFRNKMPANHARSVKIRRNIDPTMIDALTFPYAAELGLQDAKSLELHEDGADVLAWFLSGRYAALEQELVRLGKDKSVDRGVLSLNRALFCSLMSQPGKAKAHLKKARAFSKLGDLGPKSPMLDLIELEILLDHYRGETKQINEVISRLMTRTDLDAQVSARFALYRLRAAEVEGNKEAYRTLSDTHLEQILDIVGDTPWGALTGINLINLYFKYEEEALAKSFIEDFIATLRRTENLPLAVVLAQVISVGWEPDALRNEQRFQSLALQLRVLEKMVPPRQGGYLTARLNYATGLTYRSRFGEAAELIAGVIETYRAGEGFSPAIVANIQISRAWNLWQDGQPELAQTIITETYHSSLGLDWPMENRAFLAHSQSKSLLVQERYLDALEVSERVTSDADFDKAPFDQQVYVLLNQAEALMGLDRLEEARQVLDRAVDLVPFEAYFGGLVLSEALAIRSYWAYKASDEMQAYVDQRESNRIWFDRKRVLMTDADNEVVYDPQTDKRRAAQQAADGWILAQKLMSSD